MAFFTLEDATGSLEVLVFPKIMPTTMHLLNLENIVQVTGRVSDKDGEVKIIANDIQGMPNDELYLLALSEMEKNKRVTIHIQSANNPSVLDQIKVIIEQNPGQAQVYLSVGSGAGAKTLKTKSQVRVSRDFVSQLRKVPEITLVSDQ
jgi:DNA polymerase-3 subunit alpha